MSEQERIDLTLLLPHVKDDSDACIGRLEEMLRAKRGVTHAQTTVDRATSTLQLCIQFDEGQIALTELQEYAQRAGLSIEHKFGHLIERSEPMDARMAELRSSQLAQLPGVFEAVAAVDGTIRIEFDKSLTSTNELLSHIHARPADLFPSSSPQTLAAGQRTGPGDSHDHDEHAQDKHDHDHGSAASCCHGHRHTTAGGIDIELVCSIAAGIILAIGWWLSYWPSLPGFVPILFYAAAYVLTGWFMLGEALERVRVGKFEIDSLMLLAAAGAAYLGKWAEGALLLFLFSIGHALESYAMGRAKHAIESLTDLAPPTAHVDRNGQSIEVPVEELRVGEQVTIKPNERVSADGFVVQGSSSINQAPVTGESLPVDKRPVDDLIFASHHPDQLAAEHRVYAGTINGAHAIKVQVTKTSAENTLSHVVKLVSEAETRTSPTQTLTRRIELYFVPAVLIFDVLLLFAWLVIDEPFSSSLYRAMAVLVAASPCALAIATPSAVLSGIARAARGGVLIKGGGPLESLGGVQVIAFDKTGTLTEGKPRLTDVVPMAGVSRTQLLKVAVAAESLSDHPLASAIVRDGKAALSGESIPKAESLEGLIGQGLKAIVDGQPVYIGNASLFKQSPTPLPTEIHSASEQLMAQGRTTMIVQQANQYLGVLGVMDTPRSTAPHVIQELKRLGIKRMIMLSGDNQRVADAVASSIGLTEAHGDLMPEDKVRTIAALSAESGVAMVGDGVNDAPAMAGATVGIAMGAAGSDVALETADVALMADDLNHLPFAVGLSRRTRTIIRQNLWISLGMVAFLVPATALGLSLGPAVVLHEGSTLVVVLNALRLLVYAAPNRN